MSHNATALGWQDPPNGRGTFDILKSCLGTVIILCWSSVCPNVPAMKTGWWAQFWVQFSAKLNLFLLALLGPDFIFVTALGQLNAAWKAKERFRDIKRMQNCTWYRGNEAVKKYDWGLRHCFFANMGGVHLKFRDSEDGKTFPVNCNQLLYLADKGHIEMPRIVVEDIDDRNKADGLARLIAVVQSAWFTITTIGRAVQGLSMTTTELTTLAFVVLMTACSICWIRKPMDVSRPIIFAVPVKLATILEQENAPRPARGHTPLSFLPPGRQEWFMSRFWSSYYQILQDLRVAPQQNYNTGSMDHFPSIDFQPTEMKFDTFGGVAILAYSVVFMAAWNFAFPTSIERLLWRISSIMCLVYGVLGGLDGYLYHHGDDVRRLLGVKGEIDDPGLSGRDVDLAEGHLRRAGHIGEKPASFWRRFSRCFDILRNNSPGKDPELTIPLRWWISTSVLCAMYLFSRAFILLEDVIALRSLPTSAYKTIDWGPYSPIL